MDLPRGYGCAAEEPDDLDDPRCACGELWSDHRESDAILENEPRLLLDALREIDKLANRSLALSLQTRADIIKILDDTLRVCDNSTCRKFTEGDGMGDYPEGDR